MKYAILLCDGMADRPVEELKGQTPMEAACTPCMDKLVPDALLGLVKTVDDTLSPGSDVANLSVLGYDPLKYYTGRSPLEACSMGISLTESDLALRANLVTLSDEERYEDKTLLDYCAGDISTEDAAVLIEYLKQFVNSEEFSLFTGISYRHCLVWHKGAAQEVLTPPHDITGQAIAAHLGGHKKTAPLYDIMKKSHELLKNHPLNQKRQQEGKAPANSLWFWGQGKKPSLPCFSEEFGMQGAIVSAVDLLKGIGVCAGMEVPCVEGATGYIDTNFEGKAAAALEVLAQDCDFVYIHVEAPDECGHRGEVHQKVKAIEAIDSRVLRPLLEGLSVYDNYRLLILPDHPTPLSVKTHTRDAVPFLLYEKNKPYQSGQVQFTEKTCQSAGLLVEPGCRLAREYLLG